MTVQATSLTLRVYVSFWSPGSTPKVGLPVQLTGHYQVLYSRIRNSLCKVAFVAPLDVGCLYVIVCPSLLGSSGHLHPLPYYYYLSKSRHGILHERKNTDCLRLEPGPNLYNPIQ